MTYESASNEDKAANLALPRRTVLRAAVVSMGVAACSGPAQPGPAQPAPGWQRLRAALSGQLVTPADSGYQTARQTFNQVFDVNRPAAVAFCSSEADVQACVAFAKDNALPIAARSGGHSYAGYSSPVGGLVVDVTRLSGVKVLGERAEIGSGTRLIDVYAGLADAGRMLGGGTCPSVGVAGLTMGGGVGVLTRKFGLTCDQLVSARIVTADGAVRVASATSEPDLFWGIRGGGGGNFGIATQFTFTTAPVSEFTFFTMEFAPGNTASIITNWLRFMSTAPDELWTTLHASSGPQPRAQIFGCAMAAPGSEALIGQLRDALGLAPANQFSVRTNFVDAMKLMGRCSESALEQCHPSWTGNSDGQIPREAFVGSSRVVWSTDVDTRRIESGLVGKPGLFFMFESLGGAVGRVPSEATAFAHRSAIASIQINHVVESDPAEPRARLDQARDLLGQVCGETAYVNYIDRRMPNWETAYYGANLPRLRHVARTYDPAGLFAFPQAIRP